MAILLIPLLGACAANRSFAPAGAETESSQGFAAALYEVRTGPSDFGGVQVKIWAEAVEERRPEASSATAAGSFVRVAAEVLSDWEEPVKLSLENARLTGLTVKNRELPAASPAEASRSESVRQGEDKTFKLGFPVADVRPKDLRSFEVLWTLRSGERTYTRKTRFVRENDGDRYYYWPYDPGWYGSAGVAARSGGGSRGWGSGVSIGLGVGLGN